MKRHLMLSICLVAVALFTLGANESCKAPMDATGTYSGTWSINITEGETVVDTVECDSIRMTLSQDVTLNPPKNLNVTGTVYIDDYSCLEEAGWPAWLIPETKEVQVSGTMGVKNGKIVLGSGGVGTGAGIIFIIDGYGESEEQLGDEIPEMIKYSGNWGLAISVVFIGTGGVGGTFDVTRDEEPITTTTTTSEETTTTTTIES